MTVEKEEEEKSEKQKKDSPHVEILNIDILVRCRLALAPEEEAFLGWGLFDWDVLEIKKIFKFF